ncbi:MAG: hypothetical protein D3916_00735 [Candidatus Electrothrix sp. MAN1_4]|nr:hypothetical protein [Candidatus Electrothrix sp. MAN1_4]
MYNVLPEKYISSLYRIKKHISKYIKMIKRYIFLISRYIISTFLKKKYTFFRFLSFSKPIWPFSFLSLTKC